MEIAESLGCDINDITHAIDYLRKLKGVEIPDGRTRRKSLTMKTRNKSSRTPAPCADDPEAA